MPDGGANGPTPAGLYIGLIGGPTVPIPGWIELLKSTLRSASDRAASRFVYSM